MLNLEVIKRCQREDDEAYQKVLENKEYKTMLTPRCLPEQNP